MGTGRIERIEPAAAGLLLGKAFRALVSAVSVFVVSAATAAMVWRALEIVVAGDAQRAELACLAPTMFLALAILFGGVLVSGWILDRLPRRIVAVVLVAYLLQYAGSALLVVLGATLTVLGAVEPPPDLENVRWWQAAAAYVWLLVIIGAFGWSGLRFGLWMLFVPREHYFAARGWRPRGTFLGTVFRYLGLPPFLAVVREGRVRLGALYLAVAIVNSGVIGWFVLAPLLIVPAELTEPFWNAGTALVGVLMVAQLVGVGRWLVRRADALAVDVYRRVREWDERPPVVFLRRFDRDAEKLLPGGQDATAMLAGVWQFRTLDDVLLETASGYGPLVAIGDPRDPIPPLGAARIFVADMGADWQVVVRDLVEASRVVVMWVSDSAGVRWELRLLGEDVGAKRILLADPRLSDEHNLALFGEVALELASMTPEAGQKPIAAFVDPEEGWRLLTARYETLQVYTAAISYALQAMFGADGPVPGRSPR